MLKSTMLPAGGPIVMASRNVVIIATAALAALFVGYAGANAESITMPDTLNVPANQELSLEVQATGVQIYECKAGKDEPTRFEWALKAPEADLYDSTNRKIGKHYAGPTWESADGSKVVGELKAKDNGPDSDAIPWLLLTAKSTSGNGIFAKTMSIQRVNTSGGKAPAGGCSQSQAGKEMRVEYKATYRFYTAKP